MEKTTDVELKFPIDFGECAVCHTKETVAGTVCKEEIAKNKIMLGTKAFLQVTQVTIGDPKNPALSLPALRCFYDVCAKCGTVRAVHALDEFARFVDDRTQTETNWYDKYDREDIKAWLRQRMTAEVAQ
jgi:hypothetical protein